MEFNNDNSILSNNTSSQINNEVGNLVEHSEVTSYSMRRNNGYSSSENVVTSSTGDFYGNASNFDEQVSLIQCTKLLLGGEWIEIPTGLIDDELTFRFVLNKESFLSLSQAAQNHLKRYLPESDITSLDDLLDCTFSNDKNFFFGNPMEKFFKKICDGYFSSVDHVQLRDHKRVLYDHYIRHHQMNLLKKLLVSRHMLLENASKRKENIGENSKDYIPLTSSIKNLFGELKPQIKSVTTNSDCSTRRLAKHSNIRRRAKIRARLMLDDCRVKSGQNPGPSSDDSANEEGCSVNPLPQNARSTMYTEKFSADLDLYQPIKMRDVADLYREYCYLREVEPDCPSLDITDITLEEVYERTGISFQTERNFFKITEQNFAQISNKQKYPQKQQTQQDQQQQHFCNGGSISSQDEIKREIASPIINSFSVESNN